MKHIVTLISFLVASCCVQAQDLINAELLHTWTPAELMAQSVFGAQSDVSMYKITYGTLDAQGEPTIATGALFVPELAGCDLPLAVYNHGTVYLKSDVPSNNNGEAFIGKYMAGFGFLGILPDYLGLGDSPGMHPYMHADTEASATIDMIRAVKEFCENENLMLNDQLFISGYSQGGHAAMATVYEIETNLSDEFTVTAAAPASGPYDISETQAAPMTEDQPYASPEYLPYVLFSYQSVYGTLFSDPSEIFVSPYDETLPPLFDGMTGGGTIAAALPNIPNEILQPEQLDGFINDPTHPLRIALEDNNRYNWAPQTPMKLYYCTLDDQVFHENSLLTAAIMMENGANSVTAEDMGAFDHGGCAQPALFAILTWFSDLKEDCSNVGISENKIEAKLFPNPAKDQVQIQFETPVATTLWLLDITGKLVLEQRVNGDEVTLNVSDLARGIYMLRMDGNPAFNKRVVLH